MKTTMVLFILAVFSLVADGCVDTKSPTQTVEATKEKAEGPQELPEAPEMGEAPKHEEPGQPAPEPRQAAKHEENRSDWPGVSTDLHEAPALYLGRMTASPSPLLRKPKYPTDIVHFINEGHIVEVLAEEGPTIDYRGTPMATIPARVGPYMGWVLKDQVKREDKVVFDSDSLWDLLKRSAEPGKAPPAQGCTPVVALMDLTPSPGEEAVSYALGDMGCDTLLGIFDNADSPRLLAKVSGERIQESRFLRQAHGPNLLIVHTQWHDAPQHSGEFHRFFAQTSSGFREILKLESALFDTRQMPARYETSTFAYPDPQTSGRPYVQRQKVVRLIEEGGKESIETIEQFYRWANQTLDTVEPPAGVEKLPNPLPSIEVHQPEAAQ